MVKIKNPTPETSETTNEVSWLQSKQLKYGLLALVGVVVIGVGLGVVTKVFNRDPDSAPVIAQNDDGTINYDAWSNPERQEVEDDVFVGQEVTIEGTVMAVIDQSVPGFGKPESDNEHHLLIAINGNKRQPVFIRYVSDTRTTPFEFDDVIVATGRTKHLLGKDGIYVPSMEAEIVEEQ